MAMHEQGEHAKLPLALRRARLVGRVGLGMTTVGLVWFVVGAFTMPGWLACFGLGLFIVGPGVRGTQRNLERRWFLKETGISLPSGRRVTDKSTTPGA